MPKTINVKVKLYFINCKENTQNKSLISIIIVAKNRFYIKAMCFIWNKVKTKFLNKNKVKLLQK